MIHVEFRDFQDMLSFARQLLGQVEGEKVEKPVQSAVVAPVAAPVAPTVPIQSVPVTPVVPYQHKRRWFSQYQRHRFKHLCRLRPLHTRRMIWQELHLL